MVMVLAIVVILIMAMVGKFQYSLYVEEDHRNLNLGLTVFKTLHEGKSGRPFISLGAGIHHQCDEDESTPYPEPR